MRKEIKGYEGLYEIDSDGDVYNLLNGNILKGSLNSYGYRVVSLYKNKHRKVYKHHQLLARAFIPNPNNYNCVNHKDGNKLNNCIENLEWCTKSQNNKHARYELDIDWSSKPVIQSTFEGKFIAIWATSRRAAFNLNGSSVLISACCRGTAQSAYGYRWSYADKARLLQLSDDF